MNAVIIICIFVGALFLLLKSASWFVGGAVGIAHIFNVPKIIIGIILVSLATTLPEFSVSVQAAYLGYPEVALGNAIGSVMCDGVALAIAAIISLTIPVDKDVLRRFGPFLIGGALLSYLFAFDASIERYEGIILVLLLIVYFYYLIKSEKSRSRERKEQKMQIEEVTSDDPDLKKIIIFFIIGTVGVILSSRVIIWSGLKLARIFEVPEIIIGLTMVAVGTSLPEITTAIISALKGHGEVAVGNVLGADVLNLLWIIGAAATVNPMKVNPKTIVFAYPWMILVVAVMLLMMRYKYQFSRKKGLLLLGLYVVYLYQMTKWMYS